VRLAARHCTLRLGPKTPPSFAVKSANPQSALGQMRRSMLGSAVKIAAFASRGPAKLRDFSALVAHHERSAENTEPPLLQLIGLKLQNFDGSDT
jgi:hypothetical protein